MKRNELDNIFTAKVNEYLANGYMINTNTMGGSQGEIAHIDFRKGDEIIRILMETKYNWREGDTIHIIVGRSTDTVYFERDHETVWNNHLEIIEDLAFLKVSDNWFTSTEENEAINELRHERWTLQHIADTRQLTPTAAFICSLKNRKGFSNATKNNITVERTPRGYTIKLAARDGHVSRTEVIKFKK